MTLSSNFTLLDLQGSEEDLAKFASRFDERPNLGPCPEHLRIPVVIRGYIDHAWGDFDGTSQEFVVVVEKLEIDTKEETK